MSCAEQKEWGPWAGRIGAIALAAVAVGAGCGDEPSDSGGGGRGAGGASAGSHEGPLHACTTPRRGATRGSAVATTPDETRVVTVNGGAGTVSVMEIDESDGQQHTRKLADVDVGAEPTEVVIDGCGTSAYVISRGQQTLTRIVNLDSTPSVASVVRTGPASTSISISADNTKVLVRDRVGATVVGYDAVTLAALPTPDLTGAAGSASLDPPAWPTGEGPSSIQPVLFHACSVGLDCDEKTGAGSSCFQGVCQPPALTARYWGAAQEESSVPKLAYNWNSTISLQNAGTLQALQLHGGATLVADGPFNAIQYVSGTSDFSALHVNAPLGSAAYAVDHDAIDLAARAELDDLPYTVSAFVLQNGASPPTGGIATPQDNTWDTVVLADSLFRLDVQSNTGAVRFGVYTTATNAFSTFETGPGALRKNEWHKIRAIYDNGESFRVKIYVDERLVASGSPSLGGMKRAMPANQKHHMWLSDTAPASSFYGRIAGVWAIAGVAHPHDSEARLRAAFNMDGPFYAVQNGTSRYTLQAISRSKVPDNTVMFYANPASLDAPVVDATNPMSAVSTKVFDLRTAAKQPVMTGFHLKHMTQATYEAWIYRTTDSGAQEWVLNNQNAYMAIDAADKVKCGFVDAVAPTAKPTTTGTTSIALDRWYHVLCSFDGRTTKVWVNGVLEGSADVTSGTPGYYAAANANLYVGYLTSGFKGKVTGVRVWDRARAPEGNCFGKCTSGVAASTACYNTDTREASTCGTWNANYCNVSCTYASAASDGCYHVATATTTTCGSFGVSNQSCGAVCTLHVPCSTACGTAPASTCGGYAPYGTPICQGAGEMSVPGRLASMIDNLDALPTVSFSVTTPSGARGSLASEYTMEGGRLNKVPVSWVWRGVLTSASTRVAFRARCAGSTAPDVCDPALLVYKRTVKQLAGPPVVEQYGPWRVYVNSDSPNAGTSNGRDAHIAFDYGIMTSTHDYHVIAYSEIRGTSLVNIEYSVDGGVTWSLGFKDGSTIGTPPPNPAGVFGGLQNVGGTLVKVGPVQSQDSLMLMDPSTSAPHGVMWVFNPTKMQVSEPGIDPILGTSNQGTLQLGSGWTGGTSATPSNAYALVGLSTPMSGPGNVEQYFDLVHFPVNANVASATHPNWAPTDGTQLRGSGYCPAGLHYTPGRWELAVTASTTFPVGTNPHWDGSPHLASEMSNVLECFGGRCPPEGQDLFPRGTGNDLAFLATLYRYTGTGTATPTSTSAVEVQRRYVPRGLLGARPGFKNTVVFDFLVPDDGATSPNNYYFLCFDHIGPHVAIDGATTAVRNRDTAEIKVATANIEYHDDRSSWGDILVQSEGGVKNAIDFLGRGADYSNFEIRFKNNRGRWRWDADIVNFNELQEEHPDFDPFSTILDRVRAQSAFRDGWQSVRGDSRKTSALSFTDSRDALLLSNPRAAPVGPVAFAQSDIEAAADALDIRYTPNSIAVDDRSFEFTGVTGFTGFTVPMRAAANRVSGTGGFAGKPVTVFHVYWASGGDDNVMARRKANADNQVEIVAQLLLQRPSSFNPAANPNLHDPDNRIILLGDFNTANTRYAEINHTLAAMREKFGYAIDVAQAVTDRSDDLARTLDSHYNSLPLMKLLLPNEMYDSAGVPTGYFSPYAWDADKTNHFRVPGPLPNLGNERFYPWWTSTLTGFEDGRADGAGPERLDVVLLVGRGWSKDDPVRGYTVPPTAENPSGQIGENPMAGRGQDGRPELGAIDIRQWCELSREHNSGDLVRSHPTSYEPEFDRVCKDEPGKKVAWLSDHKPVGARLRVRH
jgi:hypothetical protein